MIIAAATRGNEEEEEDDNETVSLMYAQAYQKWARRYTCEGNGRAFDAWWRKYTE